MGWDGITTSHRYTRKDVNTYLRSQWHHAKDINGGHFEVIKSATKGNLWVALIKHTLSDGQTGLCLQNHPLGVHKQRVLIQRPWRPLKRPTLRHSRILDQPDAR